MVKVKTKKEGENYHDRHAVLYLGFTLTVLGQQQAQGLAELARLARLARLLIS